MSEDHGVPGDLPTVTTEVEPRRSPPPEGIVLPKIPASLFWLVSTAVSVSLIVFAINYYFFNIAD
jgi:hypothetical protein